MKIVLVYFLLLQIAVIKTKYVENRQGVDLKSVGPKVRPGKKYNGLKEIKGQTSNTIQIKRSYIAVQKCFIISWFCSCTNDSIGHSLLFLWNTGYERQTLASRLDGNCLLITFQIQLLIIFAFSLGVFCAGKLLIEEYGRIKIILERALETQCGQAED